MRLDSRTVFTCALLVSGLASGLAQAQPLELTVDPARSTLDLTIELQTAAGNRTDTDSSPINGTIVLGADDYGAPASVVLYDIRLFASDTLQFNWSWGFLGSADATMTGGGFIDATPGVPKGPVPVTSTAFTVPSVAIQPLGVLDANYNILIVGSGSVSQDLANEPPALTDLSSEITVIGSTVEVSSTVVFDGSFPLGDGLGTAVVSGTGTVVATGSLLGCDADLAAPFGVLNFFDISEFINLYNARDPMADFNVDAAFNFFDITAFIDAYNAGCD
jgi:hypothetical protein